MCSIHLKGTGFRVVDRGDNVGRKPQLTNQQSHDQETTEVAHRVELSYYELVASWLTIN